MKFLSAGCVRFIGPGLAMAGLVAFCWLVLGGEMGSLFDWWVVSTALAPQHVLPLVGLGIALALVGQGAFVASLVALAVGLAIGLSAEAMLLEPLSWLPDPSGLITPLSSLSAGLALLCPKRWRGAVAPLAVVLAAACAGVFVRLTDPSLRDPVYPIAGTLAAVWVVLAVGLTVRAFRQGWFEIAGRIAGSWLVTIALLHGGAVIAQAVRTPQPLPQLAYPPDPAVPMSDGDLFPDPDAPDDMSSVPSGFGVSRQP